jgi:SAM-dependent methyltransferase
MFNVFKANSSEKTRDFYNGLSQGTNRRGIWGLEQRFDPDSIATKPSVLRHFLPVVRRYLNAQDHCLDLGCGPGGFLSLMSPLCHTIVGADIVPDFVQRATATIERRQLTNARVILLNGQTLPFGKATFDKVVMVDTIHHLEDISATISEVSRVLKPGGLFLILEPNLLNPLLALFCLLDKNEHGLLRLGTFSRYHKLLGRQFAIECQEYNGVLVGPEGRASIAMADFFSGPGRNWMGCLSPKLFIAARRV